MKKLVSETLNEFVDTTKKVFKGEQPTGLTIDDVDAKEFLVGIEHEKIHSSDLAVRRSLVFQNLSDNKKFYSELVKSGIVKDPATLNIYKKYFIDKDEPEEQELQSLK